ncbi:MAG: DUF1425 domain-containing protein [Verrucomicrobia bacterium]|nr:MAG: DUF1425 domain-containing protein [Verrucomicrobiota bacterium]
MNHRIIAALAASSVGLLFATGCRPVGEAAGSATHTVVTGHEGGAYKPKNSDKYALENQDRFVAMDYRVQRSVTPTALQALPMPDGRLEVVANIRNRIERRIQVQIQCVFKDANGFSTGDETPWQDLILTESSQETVRFQSLNDKAKTYTIRVREAH